MTHFPIKKSKIKLCDYPYQRDIENRLLLSNLNQVEVDLLQELFHYSLDISLADLKASLDMSVETILTLLKKFASTGLFRIEEKRLVLNKELRRYFEWELNKFHEKFEPGMEHLQQLLSKVPIHVLPFWYALPKSCDKIFPAIVEKFFSHPKIYQRYLAEIQFPNPVLKHIKEAVFTSPSYKLPASAIQEALSLSPKQFHEALLLLEFHLVLTLSYERVGDRWQEVVTPFHEWRSYQLFLKNSNASSIEDVSKIERTHSHDFGFIEDLTKLLKKCPQKLSKIEPSLVEKAVLMHFAEIQEESLIFLPKAEEWLSMNIYEKALSMTRHPIQVEKGLSRVLHSKWIMVEDYLNGFIEPLRHHEPIRLKSQGKRWKYQIPIYNEEEKALIEKTLLQRLYEAGIVATGTYLGKPCFCVTPFGISLFE